MGNKLFHRGHKGDGEDNGAKKSSARESGSGQASDILTEEEVEHIQVLRRSAVQ